MNSLKNKKVLAAYILGAVFVVCISGMCDMYLHFFSPSRTLNIPSGIMKYVYTISGFFRYIVYLVAILIILAINLPKKRKFSELFSFRKISKKVVMISVTIGVLFGFSAIVNDIIVTIGLKRAFSDFTRDTSQNSYLVNLIKNSLVLLFTGAVFTVIKTLSVEMLFRGWFFSKLEAHGNARLAIIITTLLTAVIFPHGFGIVIAFILCLIYYKTRSVWPAVLVSLVLSVFSPISIMLEKTKLLHSPVMSTADVVSAFIYRSRMKYTEYFIVAIKGYIQLNFLSVISLAIVSAVVIWYLLRMKSEDLR